jgi:hypothetical protein
MSTRVKNSVHELIHSLTKSEKRYFKLFSSRHIIGESNNYVLLFDYIEKQSEYDEDQLFKDFKGEAFLNKFSITKKRLYDQILASLDAFHSNASIEAQLRTMLHSVDILYKKSLYDQCNDILRSAEKLALKNNLYIILMEIGKKKKRLLENKGYTSIDIENIHEILKQDEYYMNKEELYNKLWSIKSKLFHQLGQKGSSRNQEDINTFKIIMEELIHSNKLEDFDAETAYLYHHTYSAYYFALNDFNACLNHLTTNIQAFETNKTHLQQHPNSYFSTLTNAIFVAEKLENHKRATQLLNQLKSWSNQLDATTNEDLKLKLFSSINSIEINIYLRRGEYQKAETLIPIVETGIRLYQDKLTIQRRCYLEFKLAVIYMGLQNFQKALKWINEILNNKELDQKQDIYGYTMILDLLVHLELKHHDLLPYSIKNTMRFLKGRNRLFAVEKVLLQFISKLHKTKDLLDQETIWEEIYIELNKLNQVEPESTALEYFDFRAWAESKFKRKSFQDIIQTNYNNSKMINIE